MQLLSNQTGEEEAWLEDNMLQFKALAAAGDEDFIELMNELEQKKLHS